ncbi:hypothetical protein [Geoalkalibacter halelectricus]|uniref:Uncharacterized protein n=1 Tax=Geoalkalibacter halelectricus TaxID=2847045 RepID=A0ABY5ZK96_9BACT|nr:hypothetical protein [Geoalkalibacter halelectricus]MDO3376799.1 hypothetical protein [Geoalkalibacter halelectricus]UWZ79558.1 hypothetical protein L9S41_18035 [Geoalkalibacter halelectricus]
MAPFRNAVIAGVFILCCVLAGFVAPGHAEDFVWPEAADYRSGQTYAGRYNPQDLFWSYAPQGPYRSSLAPDHLAAVRCVAARDSLQARGYWAGRLLEDGGCGPAGDPRILAVGNFLNYLEGGEAHE